MKAIELFAGVGGFRLGLERAGHEVIWSNEWDKYAAQTYNKNFGGEINQEDITKVDPKDVPAHDLIVGGFPCQAFSIAGKRRGMDETRGTLFFEIMRIAIWHKTKYLFLENVKGLLNHDGGRTFETILRTLDELGYDVQWQVLNSKNFGVPQNRERVFIVGHLRGEPRPQVFPLGNDTETSFGLPGQQGNTLTARYYGGQANGTYVAERELDAQAVIEQFEEVRFSNLSPTLRTPAGGGHIPMVAMTEVRTEEAKEIRRQTKDRDFSPRRGKILVPRTDGMANTVTAGLGKEAFITDLTQGFPDGWTDGVSDTQRYKQMGNAVTVNVIEAIARKL
jgi:DNA (cytosine-5)-methyltransferase 1